MTDSAGTDREAGGTASRVAVVLTPDTPRPLAEIGRILALQTGLHPFDANTRVRYSGGILFEETTLEIARDLAACLESEGVQTRIVPAETLRNLKRVERARELLCRDGVLHARQASGATVPLAAVDLYAVHLYAVSAAPVAKPWTGSDWSLLHPSRRSAKKEPDPRTEALELVDQEREACADVHPVAQRLREEARASGAATPVLKLTLFRSGCRSPIAASHDDLCFSKCAEAARPAVLDRFLDLLDDLRPLCAGAWRGETIARFLETGDLGPLLYFKREEAQNCDRWIHLWTLLGSGESGSRPTETPPDEHS